MVVRSMSKKRKEHIGTMDSEIRDLILKYGEKLTDRDQIDMLSEIYPKEDVKFANLLLIDEYTGIQAISLWVKTILSLRVSKGRKGRKEIIETIKGLIASGKANIEGKTSMAFKRLFMGEEEQ